MAKPTLSNEMVDDDDDDGPVARKVGEEEELLPSPAIVSDSGMSRSVKLASSMSRLVSRSLEAGWLEVEEVEDDAGAETAAGCW